MPEIGATLREARIRAKVDISEVEAATKIRAKYLRAIENEEWDLLPGPTFTRSFLRTYAQHLGLDARLLLEEYRSRFDRPTEADLPPISPGRAREPERQGPGIPRWAVTAGVFLALLVALYFVGKAGQGGSSPPRHAVRVPTTHRVVTPTVAASVPAKPTVATLTLVPTGSLYVCLVDATGNKLIAGRVFALGQTIPSFHRPLMRLTLGNANVTMRVNGHPVTVPASAGAIGFELSPSGVRRLHAKLPTCA